MHLRGQVRQVLLYFNYLYTNNSTIYFPACYVPAQHFAYIVSSTLTTSCEIGVITSMHKKERRLRQMDNVPKVTLLES